MPKLFVWDFHGVLEKGNDDAVTHITNHALKEHGYEKRMTQEESNFLSGRKWHEYFAYLLPEENPEKHHSLQQTCFIFQEQNQHIVAQHIALTDHAKIVLEAIKNSPFQQILISNTAQSALEKFVATVGISEYFPQGYCFGMDGHRVKTSKKEFLKSYLQDRHFPQGLITIGDSPGDVALAELHSSGVSYLYSHPGRVHREASSTYRIQDLRAILQEVDS